MALFFVFLLGIIPIHAAPPILFRGDGYWREPPPPHNPPEPKRKSVSKLCAEINTVINDLNGPDKNKPLGIPLRADPGQTVLKAAEQLRTYFVDVDLVNKLVKHKVINGNNKVYFLNPNFNPGGPISWYDIQLPHSFCVDAKTPKPRKGIVQQLVIPTIEFYFQSEYARIYSHTIHCRMASTTLLNVLCHLQRQHDTTPSLLAKLDHKVKSYREQAVAILICNALVKNKSAPKQLVDFLLAKLDPKNIEPDALQIALGNKMTAWDIRSHQGKVLDYLGKTGKAGVKALPIIRGFLKNPHYRNRISAARAYAQICATAKVDRNDPGWKEAIAEWQKFLNDYQEALRKQYKRK